MEKNNINNETPGDRLLSVITKYFGNQTIFANLINKDKGSLSSYIKGRYNITKKFALDLESLVGINADYILNGNTPIMKDKERKPIHDGVSVPVVRKVDFKTQTTQHGFTKQYIMQDEHNETNIKDSGEANIVTLLFGNFKTPIPLILSHFSIDFGKTYNIPFGSILLFKEKETFEDGDYVLYKKGKKCKIGIYNNNQLIELKENTIENIDNINIFGSLIFKIESFTY